MSSAGFVALAGRPNVGKSSFLNAAVGEKVAIVSDRPQTTRRAVRGVLSLAQTQIVFVDLPGVQRPRDLLTERMASTVQAQLAGADTALLMLDGEHPPGPGDRFIARTLADARLEVTIAVNKVDRLSRAQTAQALLAAAQLLPDSDVFPISARTGEGLAPLIAHLARLMPVGPFLYAQRERSDQPLELLLAELVREAVIRRTFEELPHAVEVAVEELEQVREGLVRIGASIWVETESQKRIVVGASGRMVKAIGVAARREIERKLGGQAHLDLTVRVRRDWRSEPVMLDRLGIS